MIYIYAVSVLILLVIHTLACYVDRIYSELGKFLSRVRRQHGDLGAAD